MPEQDFALNEMKTLFDSLSVSCGDIDTFVSRFFAEWFWIRGKVFCFVFKKNLRVTNIQLGELFALLRVPLGRKNPTGKVHLVSLQDYKQTFHRLLSTLLIEGTADTFQSRLGEALKIIAKSFYRMITETFIAEAYFGSCLIYTPPGTILELEAICFHSGYIHSCGPCVYVRNVYHAKPESFCNMLTKYLGGLQPKGKKRLLFRPYAHEDFSRNDRDEKDDLQSGLDDLKLFVQKQYIGGETISAFVEKMRKTFEGVLVIPPPGNSQYDEDLDAKRDTDHTLWLIMDHSSADHVFKRPGDRHYLICYDQTCSNENAFHIFDENKPAWYDHTTIPHTLMRAMINISRPYWPMGEVSLLDPFAGSGTTWLETLLETNVKFVGYDIEDMAPLVAEDNLLFFALESLALDDWEKRLDRVYSRLTKKPSDPAEMRKWRRSLECRDYAKARKVFRHFQMGKDISTFAVGPGQVLELRAFKPFVRLLFYTVLKAERRFGPAIASGAVTSDHAMAVETKVLLNQLSRLIARKKRLMKTAHAKRSAEERCVKFTGKYSNAVALNDKYLAALVAGKPWTSTSVQEIQHLNIRREFDLVITDPPYGFNTKEHMGKLAKVYVDAIRNIVRALRPNGQLVIALPEWSHTGRRIPVFTMKEFVIHQVILTAEEEGLEVFNSALQLPATQASEFPPYYWESARALRRSILHFRFREKEKLPVEAAQFNDLSTG